MRLYPLGYPVEIVASRATSMKRSSKRLRKAGERGPRCSTRFPCASKSKYMTALLPGASRTSKPLPGG